MKRLNPVGSLLGLVFTVLLFIGLGVSLWFDRGLAFNPGPVTAKSQVGVKFEGYTSHADFEKQCGQCHDPLRTNLAEKCLECHVDVSTQVQNGQGAHSLISTINQCASCHPEHHGRNFDPTLASFKLFDHSNVSFSLNWHQENYDATPMQCSVCHVGATFSTVTNQTCLDCHSAYDNKFDQAHLQDYGSDCLECHDGADQMMNFDHSQTGFSLDGKHGQIRCTDCHNATDVKGTPKECSDCHAEPNIHQGLFNQTCDTCHSTQSWSPAKLNDQTFGHLETAGFSLTRHQVDYSNQAITCSTCHPKDLETFDLQTCIECHNQHDSAFMVDHQTQYGSECMVCHDGVDRLSNFEHANFFPLEGQHAAIQCTDCHADKVFRGTPSECWQCHKEPDLHAGIFGLQCYYCHSADAWSPATLRQHVFPLNHGLNDQNAQLQCDTCHGNNYVDYTCYNCHDHRQDEITQSHQESGITEQDLPACIQCHPQGTVVSETKKP